MTPEDTSENNQKTDDAKKTDAESPTAGSPTAATTTETAAESTSVSTGSVPPGTGPGPDEALDPADDGVSKPTPATGAPARARKRKSPAWWAASVTLALTALGVIIALLAFLNDLNLFGGHSEPSPGGTQTAASQQPPTVGPDSTTVPDLFDDFSASEILSAKWRVDDPSRYFRVNQGGLEAGVMRTSPGQQAGTLTARPGRRITGVTLDATILAGQGPSEGGLYIILIGESGQQRRLSLGPGSKLNDPVGFGVESCPTARCDSNVQYAGDGQLEIGRTYPVSIMALPDAVMVDVGGVTEPVRLPPLDGVKEMRLYSTTNLGASFTVKVDNVRFVYPDRD